jgi:aspartate/methionine/tyrosine aminotransferase
LNLPPPRLASYYERWNRIAPHKLSVSSAETMRLPELLALADPEQQRLWEELSLGYARFQGHPDLRGEISRLYGEISPEQVHTFAGAQEGIFCTLAGLLRPGNHVVTVRPCYEYLETIPRALGCEVEPVGLRADAGGWHLDLDRLESAMRADTRLIAINFPHNPTGATLTEDEMRRIAEMARERGAWLFSDEVFRLLSEKPALSAVDTYERAIGLDVMSKSFGLGGVRVGWIATRAEAALRSARNVNDYTSIANGAPDEILAIVALRARGRILERNRGIVRSNLQAASEFFARRSDLFEWSPPRAGCLAFPRISESLPVEDLADRLAREAGILMLPAGAFLSDENRFRLGLGLRSLPEVLDRLGRHL